MADAHGTNGTGGPWWVKLAKEPGSIVGALCLLFALFIVKTLWAEVQASRVEHQDLRYYLVGVCVNTADTDEQRQYCLREPRR